MSLLAVATAVIEEFDHGYGSSRIAADPRAAIGKDGGRIFTNQRGIADRLLFGLTSVECVDRLYQHLGVIQQVGADFGTQLRTFFIGHRSKVKTEARHRKAKGQNDSKDGG